jgi:hypothetical protein
LGIGNIVSSIAQGTKNERSPLGATVSGMMSISRCCVLIEQGVFEQPIAGSHSCCNRQE